jgi:hypothetical protein
MKASEPDLLAGHRQHQRRTLPAAIGGRAELRPSGRDEFRIGVAKLLGHVHTAIAVLGAARVAEDIDGGQHCLAEARSLIEHGIGQLRREFGVARQLGELRRAQQLVEDKSQIGQRRLIHEYDKFN